MNTGTVVPQVSNTGTIVPQYVPEPESGVVGASIGTRVTRAGEYNIASPT